MTNALAVCLLVSVLYCSNLSLARQIPKECSKGPSYWCSSLRQASDCGAAGHCIATVWSTQKQEIRRNPISDKFVQLFQELKDINELIDDDYLGTRVRTACRAVSQKPIAKLCKDNTAGLDTYLHHLLSSKASAETMCRAVGMCNNEKVENILALNKKTTESSKQKEHLLGRSRCTWGPSYWCSNISTGHECKATHHCVERVWSQMTFPEDKDDICNICKDMVKQARDQLQSNETQEELKEVFEGSCQLIPIKIVRKECMKLADDFVPELVETLASQMDPNAVCSVAGLCNNAKIDLMLQDYNDQLNKRIGCSSCQQTVTVVRNKFDATSYDDFLIGLLQACRNAGSLSDSCSMLVFKYYENIVAAVKKDLTPNSVCNLSGQCNYQFHQHDDYTFPVTKELSDVEDVPCEFCEKLVDHLRDVMIANTTALEFHKIMTGLCKQTGEFKTECLHLVEQYGDEIYNFLVSGLKAYEICSMIGMCGKQVQVPIAPLIPRELVVKAITQPNRLIGTDEANSYTTEKTGRVQIGDKNTNVRILGSDPNLPPLPIERMFVKVPQVEGKGVCSFCQYFLHYLQVELSDSKNEDAIKAAVDKACDRLPSSVSGECEQFVSQYGPAVIALLVQEIDPASVCPALGLCPQTQEIKRVTVNSEKSNCPLCLFAIEQLETMIKGNHTETVIKKALDSLCNRLSHDLKVQCIDFVDKYSKQLIEMLVANMDAQEICVYLKLCDNSVQDPLKITRVDKYHEQPQLRGDRNNFRGKSLLPKEMLEGNGDIETNEIPDNTVNGRVVRKPQAKTICVVCEFVMKQIDDEIKDKHNEDEIKKIVHGVCKHMPKSVRADCDQFVEKYADLVISMLAQELQPEEICRELKLCDQTHIAEVKEDILNCAVCETVVMAVKKVLSNDKVDHDIVHVVEKSCALLPAKYSARCHTMLEIYGDSIIHLIEELGTKGVCQKIGLCSADHAAYVHLRQTHKH